MSSKPELAHVAELRKLIGHREIGTTNRSPLIDAWARKYAGEWLVGQPWCGTILAHVFDQVGLLGKIPKHFYRAKDWNTVGTKLTKPAYGCVVIFDRSGGGHVGIVVGQTKTGNLKVLGGNQSNAVNIMDFTKDRVVGYRWVSAGVVPHEHRYELPILAAGTISKNEA